MSDKRQITALVLKDFRNFSEWTLEPGRELTILVGPNAAGKTNTVEAVRLLTTGSSFRSARWDELVRWEQDRAVARMTVSCGDRVTSARIEISREGRREIRIDGRTTRGASKLIGLLPSVVFTPEDLEAVKRAAEVRRSLIDDLGCELSRPYEALRREYAKVVRQRNALLREERPDLDQLASWTDQLVARGARLTLHRLGLLERMARQSRDAYAGLARGEDLVIGYASRWLGTDGSDIPAPDVGVAEHRLREGVETRAAEERARGISLVGPHRDDVVFAVDGRDARAYGSQGQQRSVALAWKLAEMQVVETVSGITPVLLLDDVMSELDEERRHALTRMVQRDAQTIVTTTNLGYFEQELLERAAIVYLGGSDA